MPLSERHQRFIDCVNALNLRFPGREIAARTGFSKTTISAYLGMKEPSENFIKTFCKQFDLDFEWIWKGIKYDVSEMDNKKEDEPTPMQILKVLADAFKDQASMMRNIEKNMARADIQAEMNFNLTRTLAGVAKIEKFQREAMEEIQNQFSQLKPSGKASSQGVRKKLGQTDGDNP